jgi:biopolymer transport protein ExbB
LQDKRVRPPGLTHKVTTLLANGQINDKHIAALIQNSPLGQVLAAGLEHRNRPHAVMLERVQDTGRHVVQDLERYLNTLGTIAGVTPLMGLLGTVSGIIKSFNAVTVGGLGNPQALSGGIAEALICTAAGLMVAIPSLIAFRYLRGRVERIVVAIEKEAMMLDDAMDAARVISSHEARGLDLELPGEQTRAA